MADGVTPEVTQGPDRTALDAVLRTLQIDRTDTDEFVGESVPWPRGRIYGGQVLAQALLAAGVTVPTTRAPHSVHAYFLRAGDPDQPITFAVERLRDGRSFSARRTHAIQEGGPILSMISSFQEEQEGLEHAEPMPEAPSPDEVPSMLDSLAGVDHPRARDFVTHAAFDLRHVPDSLFAPGPRAATDRQAVWMRARGAVDDADFAAGPPSGPAGDPGRDRRGGLPATAAVLHAALLAYACDQVLLEPVLRRHGLGWLDPGVKVASLDHAMWWHRPARADEWLLYVQRSPSARGGRGLGTASVYARDGALVATIAQEGMVRYVP
jgi:acyl-CoA thioesterase-2